MEAKHLLRCMGIRPELMRCVNRIRFRARDDFFQVSIQVHIIHVLVVFNIRAWRLTLLINRAFFCIGLFILIRNFLTSKQFFQQSFALAYRSGSHLPDPKKQSLVQVL